MPSGVGRVKEPASLSRLQRIFSSPSKYYALLPKLLMQRVAPLFAHASFRLEGQMDIHPSSRWHDPKFTGQFGGFHLPGKAPRTIADLDSWDSVRRDMLVLLLRDTIERQVPGDIAEVGVYKGQTARLIHHYAAEKVLHLYDTFEGFDTRDVAQETEAGGRKPSANHFTNTSVEGVVRYIGPKNDRVHIHQGFFPNTVLDSERDLRYCFVHLDADLYAPIMAGLIYFYPRVEHGGFIVVHDYNAWPGARKAVSEFFRGKPEIPIPMPDKSGSALIQILKPPQIRTLQ